ncbi:hypothetical protein A8B82_17325 [Sulfitobacter sp. EhC04]|jgi:N-acyl-D-aspartate/D-glutamate deacylase|uniref:hypothetical protein n=1 Tax=Aquicoccus porphyridii TaxID=1852029 RepID=UPI0007F3F157|nr:hypothetical protein [Aquicoccus porphyridii]OAN74955.1 hypothetical protein A8B82_17325 [Sulfitobacter sp. EhC04]
MARPLTSPFTSVDPAAAVPYYADICVFDRAAIASNATAKNPRRYASGVAYVLVNGKLSMRGGKRTDVNAAKVLREFEA